ncbi:UNVERIFIED_CONTAM: hypothetical protein RMT77_003300 [Armadillidium vulgare]
MAKQKGLKYFLINVILALHSSNASFPGISTSNCTCGLYNPLQVKIFGGEVAEESEFPWNAAFIHHNDIFCGGSIINEKYVLTAAHCFKYYSYRDRRLKLVSPSKVRILVGSSEMRYRPIQKGKRIFPDFRIPKLVVFHPLYSALSMTSDICIVKIHQTFKEYSHKILPICLPPYGYSFENSESIVSGWGKLYFEAPKLEKHLRKATITVWDSSICEKRLPNVFLREVMICAASPGKDSCKGDSGGPLITRLSKNQYMQIGITSFGYGCGDLSKPGVYTKVDEFVPWIMKNTKDATYCNN